MDIKKENLSRLILRLKGSDSETKLAKKIGVSQFAINRWLNKNNFPEAGNLKKIADYMDITIDELLAQLNEEETYKLKLEEVNTAQGLFTYTQHLPFQEKLILIKLLVDSLQEN